ncbi:MAG: AAA family ATPase [Bacteroidota bacterium]
MSTQLDRSQILARKTRLERARKILQQEFIGLDAIIEEVIDLIRPWWLFPQAQTRPLVVSLWGMTGTGKTALVRRLVQLLETEQAFVQVDVGEFRDNSEVWLKTFLSDDLSHHSEQPVVLCLDEFQFARSVDNGQEVNADKLRIIWELLDSGKFYYNPVPSQFFIRKASQCYELLLQCRDEGVVLEQGKIVAGKGSFRRIFRGFSFSYRYVGEEKPKLAFFLEDDFLNGLENLLEGEYTTRLQLRETIKLMDLEGLADFVLEAASNEGALKLMDLSKALIFVIGNLDEAYYMSRNINPDISADEFHHHTLKITVADVKRALQRRFRNEQIARLGNNHVLYPAFTAKDFARLIQRHLGRIRTYARTEFGFNIRFAKSVKDILYAEGVFPTQGVRPVLTTIGNLVESYLSRLVCDLAEAEIEPAEVRWKYRKEAFSLTCYDAEGEGIHELRYPIRLKVNSLRKSRNDDVQAHTAVHEAGHAVLAALTLRILPESVLTQTADSDSQGFCRVRFPEDLRTKEILRKDIIISLGGLVAEKMVFGEEQTSTGVISDLETATELANRAIKDYGMGSQPISVFIQDPDHYDSFFHKDEHETEALAIIQACEHEAETILRRNKRLLLRMASYLTTHSRMDKAQVEAFCRRYSVEPWVEQEGFIEPEAYFRFKHRIESQLAELEEGLEPPSNVKVLHPPKQHASANQSVASDGELGEEGKRKG